jgi:predicted phosphodiesterase
VEVKLRIISKMIAITGDIHRDLDIARIKILNKKAINYLIICGDFGIPWNNDRTDEYWLKWLNTKKYVVCFVDGNHENFDLLNNYQIEDWNGGKIHRISKNVLHLMRGEIYSIEGQKIFVMGGAKSTDIEYRKEHISYWKNEIPTDKEFDNGLGNLEKANWNVDYIITHTCPVEIMHELSISTNKKFEIDVVNLHLTEIMNKAKFKSWFFGHYHIDRWIDQKYRCIYKQIEYI